MSKILIIDDDVALLARLGTELEEAGHEVLRVSEIRNADMLIDECHPVMILIDTDTSRGEGWELLDRVASRLPVIVISGRGLEEDIIRGLEAGAADYLPKPFHTGELLARMRIRLRAATQVAAPPAPQAPPAPAPAVGTTEPLGKSLARPPASRRQLGEADDEPVFIPLGEEHRLLREPDALAADELRGDELAQLPLGRRLRAARQRKRITLVQAELESKVRMHYIQAMEEEKFSLLPRGPITEELLRNYVAYIGVDIPQALEEYRRLHYNAPVAPLTALGGAALPRTLPSWATWLLAVMLALLVGLGGLWLYDPGGMNTMVERARSLFAPSGIAPAPTIDPTAVLAATATIAPTTSEPTGAPPTTTSATERPAPSATP
jgi:DNA-binding response OmpR family regulator